MNHNWSLNNNNRIQERALFYLWKVYRDKKAIFQEFLENDNYGTVHVKNLQVLVTGMYKVQNIC